MFELSIHVQNPLKKKTTWSEKFIDSQLSPHTGWFQVVFPLVVVWTVLVLVPELLEVVVEFHLIVILTPRIWIWQWHPAASTDSRRGRWRGFLSLRSWGKDWVPCRSCSPGLSRLCAGFSPAQGSKKLVHCL